MKTEWEAFCHTHKCDQKTSKMLKRTWDPIFAEMCIFLTQTLCVVVQINQSVNQIVVMVIFLNHQFNVDFRILETIFFRGLTSLFTTETLLPYIPIFRNLGQSPPPKWHTYIPIYRLITCRWDLSSHPMFERSNLAFELTFT